MPCEQISHQLYLDIKLQSYLSPRSQTIPDPVPEEEGELFHLAVETSVKLRGQKGCFPSCTTRPSKGTWRSWESVAPARESSSLFQKAETCHKRKLGKKKKTFDTLSVASQALSLPPGTQLKLS